MEVPPPFFPLSPRTRRIHRGRGVVVLDNVTASSMSNSGVVPDPLGPLSSEGPSPDEMVIRARGRRALPLTFSPDVHNKTPPRRDFNGRPVSKLAMSRLLLPTRTSPRKRLTLADSPPSTSSSLCSPNTSIIMATPSPDSKVKRSPVSKKCRLEPPSSDEPVDTTSALKGLSRDQLVALLSDLVLERPDIEAEVRCRMPLPDLAPMEERLNYLKRNVFKALPNTRLESKTDSLAYSRVAIHLMAFKKAILDQGKRLCEASAWPAVVDHALMAWGYVSATPIWDNPPHNNLRKQCFKALATNCMMALKKGVWSAEVCLDLKSKMASMEKESDDIGPCLKHLELIINNGNVP